MIKISIIAAINQSRTIGHQGTIPWSIPSDLKHFARTTKDHVVIMGRKTAESIIGTKNNLLPIDVVLPGRVNIVITKDKNWGRGGKVGQAESLSDAIAIAKHWIGDDTTKEIFIIGGAKIYKEALDMGVVDKMIISDVDSEFEGDTKFPAIDPVKWSIASESEWQQGPKDQYKFRILEFVPATKN